MKYINIRADLKRWLEHSKCCVNPLLLIVISKKIALFIPPVWVHTHIHVCANACVSV